jgi:hypothetical protein
MTYEGTKNFEKKKMLYVRPAQTKVIYSPS